jgi:hypothetical protein
MIRMISFQPDLIINGRKQGEANDKNDKLSTRFNYQWEETGRSFNNYHPYTGRKQGDPLIIITHTQGGNRGYFR